MRTLSVLLTGFVLLGLTAQADTLETAYFRADMSPANESPAITGVNVAGRAIMTAHIRRDNTGAIVGGFVDFDVDYNFSDDEGTFSGLHIHSGAAGTNGPVTINTGLAASENIAAKGSGNVLRQAPANTAAAIATLTGMLSDPSSYYVNMHTTAHPGGVIRAQLSRAEPRVFRSTLDPANEVPAINSGNKGAGALLFLATRDRQGVINAGTVTFMTTYSFASTETLSGWHIHNGAPGVNGPVVINTGIATSSADGQNVQNGSIQRRVDITSGAALDALRGIYVNPAGYYLNMHTTTNPGGAMRGPLEPTVQNVFPLSLSPANEVPAVSGLDSTAVGNLVVYSSKNSAGTTTSATVLFDINFNFAANTTFTGMHIHAAPAGNNGTVVINTDLGTANVTDADGVGNLYRVVDTSSMNQTALSAVQGLLFNPAAYYANLHTAANPGGAVRSQLGDTPAPPVINKGGILNNASYNLSTTSVAPGSIAAVYGTNLTTGVTCLSTQGCNAKLESGKVSSTLLGTSATVNGLPAPVFYTTPTQIGIQIPYEVTGSSAAIVVTAGGQTSPQENVTLDPIAPGIFSLTGDGKGAGAITHLNGSPVTAQNPAARGETLVLYATGLGATNPILGTGVLPTALTQTATATTVTVGGTSAEVLFSGLSGCCAGLNQVNFKVPAAAQTGSAVPVTISLGSKQSAPVTIAIQ